ncbi:MAG: peptidylprolyl isomerase [Gallionellaceae bacterium]
MTLKSTHIAAFALFTAIAANTVYAADKMSHQSKTLATVNGIVIPESRLELNIQALAQQGKPDTPELRKKIQNELIDLEVIAQEAHKKGLDNEAKIIQIIAVTKQNILRNAFVQDYMKHHPIADATLKQEFDKQKKALTGRKEYKVAHILVSTEKEAKSIIAKLKKKANFNKLAKAKSKDAGSKKGGGELGWTTPRAFVQPFGEAIIKLKKGKISAPVQTQFGWHVIKLEDVRNLKIPSFDQIKAQLAKRMQQVAIQKAVKALRANAKIK